MIDKQEAAIFKLKQDFNQKFQNTLNMQKIGKSYRSYVLIRQWHVISLLL